MRLFLLLIFIYPFFLFSQQTGEFKFDVTEQCLTYTERQFIFKEIEENIQLLNIDLKSDHRKKSLAFDWPLQKDTSLAFNNYFGISNYVDQDTAINSILDYNCLSRSYDGHKGTDIFTWPFPWYMYNNGYVNVIASEDGIIINKHDGYDDDHCANTMGGTWNAVYVQHYDGSVAWYGHLEKNTLTSKQIGQSVVKGEYLGKVASSGYSTGPHLHFEIYDSMWNLIDPFQGTCNILNQNSWWLNQRAYRVPTLNALLTHSAKPVHGCPGINEEPNISSNFNIGDTIFLAAYFSDRQSGDSAVYRVFDANNNLWQTWNQVTSTTFNASWYYWKRLLPQNGPFGYWRFEIEFQNQIFSHEFLYTNPLFIEDKQNSRRDLILITDILGRKSPIVRNKLLFYIYNDGSVEKRLIYK